jgi:hypothetical protein
MLSQEIQMPPGDVFRFGGMPLFLSILDRHLSSSGSVHFSRNIAGLIAGEEHEDRS